MATLDPTRLADLYWGGRVSLVHRHEDVESYDRLFAEFFHGDNPVDELVEIAMRAEPDAQTVLELPAADPGEGEPDEETVLGLMASDVETLKARSFAECTDAELEVLRRIMARIRLTPPRRRTRRSRPARRGRYPDPRATVRRSLRLQGEVVEPRWRRRRSRPRPVVLLLDISGSMADYSRALLQFAYSARRAAGSRFRVEVFCFGTRLTYLTPALRTRTPDEALARAAALVVDWEGGTRIGAAVDEFVRRWGRRGMARGGIAVICSDGFDRGDPELLATSMERLSRLCRRIVWTNPHAVGGRRPSTVGMMVVEPYVDVLLSGHDLSSLKELADLLPALG
ncbi:MAG: VWA domain-containing protein [Pseudonocardia sp.]|nr:VWA domain-containing protein [Pseudonocardia sp.]